MDMYVYMHVCTCMFISVEPSLIPRVIQLLLQGHIKVHCGTSYPCVCVCVCVCVTSVTNTVPTVYSEISYIHVALLVCYQID